jgi:hypothetical protein
MTTKDEWLDSSFLLVKEVNENDIISIVEEIGVVDSFDKKKFQLTVEHNGKRKTLNVNRIQYKQLSPIRAGGKYEVTKMSFNGGTILNFKPLN